MYNTYREESPWYLKRREKRKKNRCFAKPKKYKHLNVLLENVRQYIQSSTAIHFTAEKVAKEFKCYPHQVRQCFHILNREGLLYQKLNDIPHDSNRGPFWWDGGFSSWKASVYTKREKRNSICLVDINQVV